MNYDDATMFVEGPEDEDSSLRVHFDLVKLVSSTLLVHELRIGAAVGKGQILSWADEWLAKTRPVARSAWGFAATYSLFTSAEMDMTGHKCSSTTCPAAAPVSHARTTAGACRLGSW